MSISACNFPIKQGESVPWRGECPVADAISKRQTRAKHVKSVDGWWHIPPRLSIPKALGRLNGFLEILRFGFFLAHPKIGWRWLLKMTTGPLAIDNCLTYHLSCGKRPVFWLLMSCSCAHVAIWVIDNRTSSWCRASFSVVCLECGGSQLVFMDAHSIFKGCRSKKAIQNRSKFKQIYDLQLKKNVTNIAFLHFENQNVASKEWYPRYPWHPRQKLGPRARKRPEPFWPGDSIGLRWHAISTPWETSENSVKSDWDTLWLCQNSYWSHGHRNSGFSH